VRKVTFTVNSHPVEVVAHEKDTVLLDVVREDLGLTGTKQSCDRKGQCGTCMVLVEGKAVLSCITKVAALDGAEVTTIEGLGTPDAPNLVRQAFVLATSSRPPGPGHHRARRRPLQPRRVHHGG
jgi:aldehyde oxidoreductase